jgi:Flp pilus assembly CpaF family ATPase
VADPDITDIMVTGPDKVVVDRNGFYTEQMFVFVH